MPISALPEKYGIGTLGDGARSFIDFLNETSIKVWQILPIGPTGFGNSPYQSLSAFAGNEYFIDLDYLCRQGLLTESECKIPFFGDNLRRVDYGALFDNRVDLLYKAFLRFNVNDSKFIEFSENEEIFDYALFRAIKEYERNKPWYEWNEKYRDRNSIWVEQFTESNKNAVNFRLFMQYMFFIQFDELKKYAKAKNVEIFGDMPLYVSLDSSDVWSHREIFQMNEEGNPKAVAGVPPDFFSETGQLWGNPLFDWEKLKAQNYRWWNKRIEWAFRFFDILRIDHFRGFDRYYSIEYGLPNAKFGIWKDGPKFDFFEDKLDYNIVAEDLGIIDDGVKELLLRTNFPGMKILIFAFNGDLTNPYLPSNIDENSVVYTGTHDNMPLKAFLDSLDNPQFENLIRILKKESDKLNIPMKGRTKRGIGKKIIESAFASRSNMVIIPFWDLLYLGEEARMNTPSTLSEKNWSYRFIKNDFNSALKKSLRKFVSKYNR